MVLKNKKINLFVCLSLSLPFSSLSYGYTLQEAVARALATSPDFLISTANRDIVDKQLRESYAGYLPSVDMAAGWGEQYTDNVITRSASLIGVPLSTGTPGGTRTLQRTEFSLLASQMLFDGLGVYHEVQGRKARVKAEAWRVQGSAQDVALSAVEVYLDVNLRRALLHLAQQNLGAHDRVFGQIRKRSEGGIGRGADLDQAQARLALARTNLIASEANLQNAQTEFLRHIGISVPALLEVPQAPLAFPASEQEAIALGLKQHPVLHASLEDVMVAKEAQKGAKAPFAPRVDLQLGMTRNHNLDGNLGDSNDNSAMMRMRWNLFSGGRDLAKIGEAAAQRQQAQEAYLRAHRQVVESVRLAWSAYDSAKRQLTYLKEHVDASLRTREAYQKQFNIGQRTLLDLLDSENELFNAQNAYANGKDLLLRGMFRVLNATGQLTGYLDIDLPPQAQVRASGAMEGASRLFDRSSSLFDN